MNWRVKERTESATKQRQQQFSSPHLFHLFSIFFFFCLPLPFVLCCGLCYPLEMRYPYLEKYFILFVSFFFLRNTSAFPRISITVVRLFQVEKKKFAADEDTANTFAN